VLLESGSPGLPSKDRALSTSGRKLRHFHPAITFRPAALIWSQTTVTGRPAEVILCASALHFLQHLDRESVRHKDRRGAAVGTSRQQPERAMLLVIKRGHG
jgi:hypothetical protein